MNVYELSFWYQDEENDDEDEVTIAVYSSLKLAEEAREKFKKHPRFVTHENEFYIDEYKLNEPEWKEGFTTDENLYEREMTREENKEEYIVK